MPGHIIGSKSDRRRRRLTFAPVCRVRMRACFRVAGGGSCGCTLLHARPLTLHTFRVSSIQSFVATISKIFRVRSTIFLRSGRPIVCSSSRTHLNTKPTVTFCYPQSVGVANRWGCATGMRAGFTVRQNGSTPPLLDPPLPQTDQTDGLLPGVKACDPCLLHVHVAAAVGQLHLRELIVLERNAKRAPGDGFWADRNTPPR